MGNCCDQESSEFKDGVELKGLLKRNGVKQQSSKNSGSRNNTIRTLDPFYTVGFGIRALYRTIMTNLGNKTSLEDFLQLLKKHNVNLYFFDTVAYVCKGDGILGENEKNLLEIFAEENDPNISELILI